MKLKELLIESRSPQIGIFWFVGNELIQFSDDLRGKRPDSTGFVNYAGDHSQYWQQVVKQFPKLGDKEFFDIPRGRINYNTKTKQFSILGSREMLADKPKIYRIMRYFSLPIQQTRLVADLHYELNPDFDD